MARRTMGLEAFDSAVANIESAGSLGELEGVFGQVMGRYPFHGGAYAWWSYPPPIREPDYRVAAGDLVDPPSGYTAFSHDPWAASLPVLVQGNPDGAAGNYFLRVALLGPRRRFGILTAALDIASDELEDAAHDWRGRFLLLAHVVQHQVGLWIPDARPTLGRREVQCLKLAAEGLKAKQIAITLGIGQQTVQFHLSRAREKLDCSNTVQAVARAAQYGLLPDIAPSGMQGPRD